VQREKGDQETWLKAAQKGDGRTEKAWATSEEQPRNITPARRSRNNKPVLGGRIGESGKRV